MPSTDGLRVSVRGKSFSSGNAHRRVFRDFEFAVSPGEFVCILGPSGCGKTTLLRMIAGLDQDFKGEVRIGDERVDAPGRDRSLVFQQARLLPWMTVGENVDFALDRDIPEDRRVEMIDASLRLVGLERARDMRTFHLSGGMRTRAALARAIADPPTTLLLDEPFSALDFYTREAIHNNIVQIQDEHDFTILMVTHDLDEAIYLSDRIIVLTDPPAAITDDFQIGMDRPRDRGDSRFKEYQSRLLGAMRAAHDSREEQS